MDTTNSSDNQQRRVEDRKPVEVIDWAAPGAPAVPLSPTATYGTDEFMVYGRAGNRRADLEAKLRDALTASIPSPAATSGDAPADLQQLKALALAATNAKTVSEQGAALAEFSRVMALTSPAVVLGLIVRIEHQGRLLTEARAVLETWKDIVPAVSLCTDIDKALPASATASGDELPPLPEPKYCADDLTDIFTADQMHAYARAAVSAATKPTADLSREEISRIIEHTADTEGFDTTTAEGVDALIHAVVEQVQSLLATKPAAAASAVPVELMGVREEIEAGSGFWHTCSGCHESEDGHPVGLYHYSEAMRCALGTGCSECGGIGAVWDNNDYDATARDWDEPDAASTIGAAQTAEEGGEK